MIIIIQARNYGNGENMRKKRNELIPQKYLRNSNKQRNRCKSSSNSINEIDTKVT